jgi:hypothetical protein
VGRHRHPDDLSELSDEVDAVRAELRLPPADPLAALRRRPDAAAPQVARDRRRAPV